MNKKPHLITTSAYFENDKIREEQYVQSFEDIKKYKKLFKTITIIETISQNKIEYITNTTFKSFYSKVGNPHKNKGSNWVLHVENFLLNSNIKGEDIIIFITGRYRLINENIIEIINDYMVSKDYDMLAKDDSDIYDGSGVHTFFIVFTKNKFLNFSMWYKKDGDKDLCVEWEMKKYMKNNNKCFIIDKTKIMGVETNVSGSNKKYLV